MCSPHSTQVGYLTNPGASSIFRGSSWHLLCPRQDKHCWELQVKEEKLRHGCGMHTRGPDFFWANCFNSFYVAFTYLNCFPLVFAVAAIFVVTFGPVILN